MSSSQTTIAESELFEFSNCTKQYIPLKDEKYVDCVQFLPNNSDACDYLKDLHHARSISHYAIGLIPLIISIFAFLINLIFIYICVCIIKDKQNPCRKTYLFNLTRSISSITGLVIFYCVLIAWKIEKLEKVLVIILFTFGTWSFSLQALSYGWMARTVEIGCIIAPENYHLIFTMKNYLKFFKCIWLSSVLFSVVFCCGYITLQILLDLTTAGIIQFTILAVASLLFIAYFSLIGTNFRMLLTIRKLQKNNEGSVRHINTKNNIAIYRLIYVTTNCILTKVSLLIIAVLCFNSMSDLDGLTEDDFDIINPTCQKFLQGKTYIKIFIFGGIMLILVIIGMISDPLISFLCDYENIKPLLLERYELWKRKIESFRNGQQEDK